MIITLLSDFGYQDNYAAVAKGLLLRELPAARLVDLSHNVEPYHLLECSYLLKTSCAHFPPGTVHLSLFNILHHRPAEILILERNGQYIVSADNGLLPLAFEDLPDEVHRCPQTASSYMEWMQFTALMLRGLQETGFRLEAFPLHTVARKGAHVEPLQKQDDIECQVIHIDYYGNVVVNITRSRFDEIRNGRSFTIRVVRETLSLISEDYADVPQGRALCRFNSAGYLEIAVNQGNAARLLGLRLHQEKMIYYQHVKIEFI